MASSSDIIRANECSEVVMAKRVIKVHNKFSKPDNIVQKEHGYQQKCREIENDLPPFLMDYFIYLKNAVAISTRLAYLKDLHFFCRYLCNETGLTQAEEAKDISLADFQALRARDINRYLGDYCTQYYVDQGEVTYVMENHNRSLSRKRSSLSVLFKFLFREEAIENNITDGFNPIKLPKPQPDAIKKLEIDEVAMMIDAVETGEGLTDKEKQYWKKTKHRDKAILVLFVTYGLRLSELQQLNISSFNFRRGEFKIYRKRGKEVTMPINNTIETTIKEYLDLDRDMAQKVQVGHEDALFLSLQGKRMTLNAICKLVKKYSSIGMGTNREDGYSPHKLRATAASSLIEYGFSIYDVQNLLDHDNVTTTQLYAAHRKNLKRDIIKNYEILDEFNE